MGSLPAPCPGDHWPRGCGDGSPAAPTPGRCASCCPPARRRRWRRGRSRCAATPRPSSTPRRCAWRPWSRPSGAAAADTRRSPICCAASRPPGTARASGSSTTRVATLAENAAETAALFHEFFGPLAGPVRVGFEGWAGADVAVATGWQTVAQVLRLPGASARAYLVQDHEPEFYPTSAERDWAAWTYRQGLHCIAASPWLADLVRTRYGASATSFDLGIDHERYRPVDVERRADRVLFYARAVTPRRAVPLGLLALEELHRRRPQIEIALFGEARPIAAPFPYRPLGVLEAGAPGAGVLRGDRRPRAVAHQPVAHPPGDAGLRPALRRRGQREHARHLRRGRPGDARGARADRAVRGHRGAARRPRAARPPRRRGAALGGRAHVAGRRGARCRTGCVRRCVRRRSRRRPYPVASVDAPRCPRGRRLEDVHHPPRAGAHAQGACPAPLPPNGARRPARVARRLLRRRARGVLRHRRAQRVGQVDAAEVPGRHLPDRPGGDLRRRPDVDLHRARASASTWTSPRTTT